MTSISAFSKLRDVTLPLLLYLLHRAHCYASNSNYKWCLLGKLWELWGRLGGLNHVWFCYAISFPSWESLQGTDPRKKPKSILESIIMNPVVTKITAVLWLLVLGSPQGCPISFWSLLPCWLAWWQHWFSKCDYWTSSTIWGLATSATPPQKKKIEKKAVSQTHLRRHKDSEVRNSLDGFVHELALQVTVIHRFESHLSLFPLAAIKIDHKFSKWKQHQFLSS